MKFHVSISGMAAALVSTLVLTMNGCGGTGGEEDRGTLVVQYQLGEDKAVTTCDILDTRQTLYSMEVSDGEVVAGATDDLEWFSVHEGSGEATLTSEKMFSSELPVGTYSNYKIDQGNLVEWICSCGGSELELPSLNDSTQPPDAHAPINIVNSDGCWGLDESGQFYLMAEGETAGGFEIRPGGTTTVTIRVNLVTLDWNDADESGDWSDGDSIDNWSTSPGVTSMFDFIVEYD